MMVLPILIPPVTANWVPIAAAVHREHPPPNGAAKEREVRINGVPWRRKADAIRLGRMGTAKTGTNADARPAAGLLAECEVVIMALLRRARVALGGRAGEVIRSIAASYDGRDGSVAVSRKNKSTMAWMLAAMQWRGISHPQGLLAPALHPPTPVVRWLGQFDVRQQTECARAILELLARRFRTSYGRFRHEANGLLRRARGSPCRVRLAAVWGVR